MAQRLIVIGGTAAGLSAASKARKLKPELEIQVFEKSGYISYGACGLPYFVGGMIEAPEDLVSVSEREMREKRNISILIHHEVKAIDKDKQQVRVMNLETGEEKIWDYDQLVIATGAVPIIPPIPGIDGRETYYLRNVEDGIRLKNRTVNGGNACLIGGGFIGLELAEEMSQAGVQVTLTEQNERLLPFLKTEFSQRIQEVLAEKGVKLHLGKSVDTIKTTENSKTAVLSDGQEISADFIVVCAGVRPASELAAKAGLQLGSKNAIAVDDNMKTSDPRIWACGDCAETKNRITGKQEYIPLGTTANKQGRIAGACAAGQEESFAGVVGSMVTKVFDLTIAVTGLSAERAEKEGFETESVTIRKSDRASYYPGGMDNIICLIYEKKGGRLLGAQGIGSESVAGRINTLATALTCGMTVEEINQLDLVYAPPVAPVYDPILIAASQAMKKVERY